MGINDDILVWMSFVAEEELDQSILTPALSSSGMEQNPSNEDIRQKLFHLFWFRMLLRKYAKRRRKSVVARRGGQPVGSAAGASMGDCRFYEQKSEPDL